MNKGGSVKFCSWGGFRIRPQRQAQYTFPLPLPCPHFKVMVPDSFLAHCEYLKVSFNKPSTAQAGKGKGQGSNTIVSGFLLNICCPDVPSPNS